MLVELALMLTAGATGALTIIVMALDVTVVVETQVAFDVITQVTTSPFTNEDVVNEELFVPAFVPFTFHWYAGVVPPFVGVAVKVTAVPLQILVADALMATTGVAFDPTEIVIALDVSLLGTAHPALDVNTHFTTSLFNKAVVAYVELFVPTTAPFFNHW
jgi:hypothetical protein